MNSLPSPILHTFCEMKLWASSPIWASERRACSRAKRKVDNDSYIRKLRSGIKYNCHKSVLNLENHAIYTHVRTATIDYFHYLFFSLFFIFRNKAVYIYCWTPEDKNWCAYVGWNESRTALLTNDTINYINSRQPRPLHFNINPIELNSPLVC